MRISAMLAHTSVAVGALLASSLTSCAFTDRFPFRTVANPGAAGALPPGVRVAASLDGVHESSNEGIASRAYELRVDLEQDPDAPQWLPEFDGATLRDDEGNSFPLTGWFYDGAKPKNAGLRRYRAVFELRSPYRFQSIMGATVRWKLTSKKSPAFRVTSRFER